VRVDGSTVKDAGKFVTTETLRLPGEKGVVSVNASGAGNAADYKIDYLFGAPQVASSKLLENPLFASGKYWVTGSLSIRASDGTTLAVIPLKVSQQ